MFRLTRPTAREVDDLLAARRGAPFSYAEVGATRGAPPPGYAADRRRVRVGAGADAFRRAAAALDAWRMASLGWAEIHPRAAPPAPGVVVAMVVRHYGFWSVHPCRVVYRVDDEADGVRRLGFAYGTLPGHGAAGEERFAVEWRREDDSVWYEVRAFSRPAHPLMRLGYPLARRLQRRFGGASARAMRDAVAAGAPGRA